MFAARILSFVLALVFAWAALSKVVDLGAWRRALAGYRLPKPIEAVAAVATPLAEAALSALFLLGSTRVAAAVTIGLIAIFSWTILRARLLHGSRLPCGCFGSTKERDYRMMLARNTVLAVSAGALLIFGRDVPGYPSAPSGGAWLPVGLVGLGLALVLWLILGVRAGFRRDAA